MCEFLNELTQQKKGHCEERDECGCHKIVVSEISAQFTQKKGSGD